MELSWIRRKWILIQQLHIRSKETEVQGTRKKIDNNKKKRKLLLILLKIIKLLCSLLKDHSNI